uniref:Uncharacterized protein n=1 Tax=Panagrolaimus davidi TaxID=227884 RepID=A0A914Q9X9_9BILA
MLSDQNTSLVEKLYPIISNIKLPKSPPSSDFPADVLKYMNKNPRSKEVVKLMKMNKYFVLGKCIWSFIVDFILCEHDSLSLDYYAELAKDIIMFDRYLAMAKFKNDYLKHSLEYRSVAN